MPYFFGSHAGACLEAPFHRPASRRFSLPAAMTCSGGKAILQFIVRAEPNYFTSSASPFTNRLPAWCEFTIRQATAPATGTNTMKSGHRKPVRGSRCASRIPSRATTTRTR